MEIDCIGESGMISPKEIIRHQLDTGLQLIELCTKDLNDEEYFTPATVGGNHAAWVTGHLAVSEDTLLTAIMGQAPAIAEDSRGLFSRGSECFADASCYPPRAEIEGLFRDARAHTLEHLASFDDSRWNEPSPKSLDQRFLPTLGTIWSLIAAHPWWHVGQLTYNRRALNKPRFFAGA
jgi:hypothetical protein